jgi:hypothetical protein
MKSKILAALTLSLVLLLAACNSNPPVPEVAVEPKPNLSFVDLQTFDRDLSSSLKAPLPAVDVAFYDRITPSTLPERLQKWMASVEAGGGSVKIVPPKSTVTAKNPFMVISAATSLWSANKMIKEAAVEDQFKLAKSYDAEIRLKVDDKGDTLVDRVVFVQRKK